MTISALRLRVPDSRNFSTSIPYRLTKDGTRRTDADGVGRVACGEGQLSFFFELDRGTEPHGRLRAKLHRYAEVAPLTDAPRILLFAFLTERREIEARRALFSPGFTLATTSLERSMADPLGPVWQPLGDPFLVSLLQLSGPSVEERGG
jgi:hypothetical protein